MDTLYGIISMTRSEQQLPKVSLQGLDITDVIQTLQGVAAETGINAMYNPQDTVENNLINGTGPYAVDNMEEAQTMPFQVMSVLTACPHHVSSDFRNISADVKRVRRLKGNSNDKDHSDFMVSEFQCHMENGLFHVPVADIGDRILQWGFLLDRKRNDNYFPSPTTSAGGVTVPVTDLNIKTGDSHKNTQKQGIQRNPKKASSHCPTTGILTNQTYPTCTAIAASDIQKGVADMTCNRIVCASSILSGTQGPVPLIRLFSWVVHGVDIRPVGYAP